MVDLGAVMKIREAKRGDVSKIYSLIKYYNNKAPCIVGKISENRILDSLDKFWVLEVDNRVVGCARLKKSDFVSYYEINSMCIEEGLCQKGYGSKFVEELKSKTGGVGIFVESVEPVTAFYKKQGFDIVASIPDIFYGKVKTEFGDLVKYMSTRCLKIPDKCPAYIMLCK